MKIIARQPLEATNTADKYDVKVTVKGGGFTGQAGAIRHGIARALNEADADFRPILKKAGFLTRDSRMKERKKYGLVVHHSSQNVSFWKQDYYNIGNRIVPGVFLYFGLR